MERYYVALQESKALDTSVAAQNHVVKTLLYLPRHQNPMKMLINKMSKLKENDNEHN